MDDEEDPVAAAMGLFPANYDNRVSVMNMMRNYLLGSGEIFNLGKVLSGHDFAPGMPDLVHTPGQEDYRLPNNISVPGILHGNLPILPAPRAPQLPHQELLSAMLQYPFPEENLNAWGALRSR